MIKMMINNNSDISKKRESKITMRIAKITKKNPVPVVNISNIDILFFSVPLGANRTINATRITIPMNKKIIRFTPINKKEREPKPALIDRVNESYFVMARIP